MAKHRTKGNDFLCCSSSSDCSPQGSRIMSAAFQDCTSPCVRPAPAVFDRNLLSPSAFIGRAVFRIRAAFFAFRSHPIGAKKAALWQ